MMNTYAEEDTLVRFPMYSLAALLVVACGDPLGPEPLGSDADQAAATPVALSTALAGAGSFTLSAVLGGNLVTTGNPISYTADFGHRFSSISMVTLVFTFGDDLLDKDDCLLVFPNDIGSGGFGVCNPGPAPQSSRTLTFPCSVHPVMCDAFRDGVSAGDLIAESNVPGSAVSVGLRSLSITIEGQATLAVSIDIRPGSARNSINPRSNGLIPVAIMTTPAFNATNVVASSVRFGPSGATEAHRQGHRTDVDGDGDQDLLLHFRTRATGITCAANSATLTGVTSSGQIFHASAPVHPVGCRAL
jgi:hypothetical protein